MNPKTVTVTLDWNGGTRPYSVAYADIQGHRTEAADVTASAEAAAS